jgi:hypothetical protein
MATNRISVLIDVTVDRANRALSGFRKSVSEADGAIGKFKAGAASAGASLKANIVPIAAAAGAAVVGFAAKSVQAASNLAESTNAVNVSFGEAAEGVLEIGESAAKSMGLSKSAFNEAAVGFAAFAESIAGPGGDAADVIGDLTGRAADFASVMNIEVAEAANIFRSSLSGETEPIKKFGIDLSAAAVEAFALSSGLARSKGEMTEAIKVQARYGLLMEKTSKFAGDFTNTSDGLANSTRIAKAEIENFQAEIGENLLPVVADAVTALRGLSDVYAFLGEQSGKSLDNQINKIPILGEEINRALGPAVNPIKALGDAFGGLGEAFGGAADEAEAAAAKAQAATDRHAEAHIKNQRGIKAYQDQLAKDEHVKAYIDHANGMARESKRMADRMAADIQRVEDAYKQFRDGISEDNALLDLEEGWDRVAEAALEAMDGTAQSSRAYQREINNQKSRVLDFIDTLGDVPPEVTSELLAKVDRGMLEEANRQLNAIAAGRTVAFRAQVSGLDSVRGQLNRTGQAVWSHDGSIVGGPSFKGLKDDDVPMVLQKGQAVLTKGQQAAMLNAGTGNGSGGNTYNITIQTGADPKAVVDAIRTFERHHGKGWRG